MRAIPEGAPDNLGAAFAHINAVTAPTITDFKVMVLVEAAGQTLYDVSAEGTDHAGVKSLLKDNGVEEMKHAWRVSEVIRLLSGEDFPPPAREENPYLTGHIPVATLTPEGLRKTAESEFNGDQLYATWAATIDHPEAAALLRQNGVEESDHGNRLLQAAALLEG